MLPQLQRRIFTVQGVTEQGIQFSKFIVTKRIIITQQVSYRTFVNTSNFLQLFSMAATGYAADSHTIF
jgi:hypothetical protein